MRLQTPQDDKMTLKLSGKSDDVLVALLGELGLASSLPKDPKRNATFTPHQCALVPYDAMTGMRLPDGKPKMWLDLHPGAKLTHIAQRAISRWFRHTLVGRHLGNFPQRRHSFDKPQESPE